jgi:hypothetical protein
MEHAMKDSLAATSFCVEPKPTDVQRNLMNAVKTEMQLYTSTGNRGRCLQKAHDYLLSIPVTSVESERAFSAAGVLCTKLRSRLADKSIDTMCFLRSFYRKDRK